MNPLRLSVLDDDHEKTFFYRSLFIFFFNLVQYLGRLAIDYDKRSRPTTFVQVSRKSTHPSFFLLLTLGMISFSHPTSLQAASYGCQGENVTNIHGATTDAYQQYTENSTGGGGYSRYFKFTPQVDGDITITFGNTSDTRQRMYIGTSCQGSQIYYSGNSTGSSHTFSITSGETYYVRMRERNASDRIRFTISFDLTAIAIVGGCDSSLDTSANNSAPGVIVSSMHNITTDTTACISGYSDDAQGSPEKDDLYYFTVGSAGTLDMTTSSPNGHSYHLLIGSTSNGTQYYGDSTAQSHNIPSLTLAAGDSVYLKFKETGSDLDEYEMDFSFTPLSSDLSITKDIDNSSPEVDDVVTYTIVGTNNGPDTSNIIITDDLPNGLEFLSIEDDKNDFECQRADVLITCEGTQDFSNGEDVTITLKAHVRESATITNTVAITSSDDRIDPVADNDEAEVDLTSEVADALAVDDSFNAQANTTFSGNVLANDSGGGLEVTSYDPSTLTGSIISFDLLTGSFSYIPSSGFTGTDSFTYDIVDSNALTSSATVFLAVSAPEVGYTQCSDNGLSEAYREFCLRRSMLLPGDMITVGNTILVAPGTEATNNTANCNTYTNGTYIDDASSSNNNYRLCGYSVDNDSSTASTTAEVSGIPTDGSRIRFAGLYWQALIDNATGIETTANIQIRKDGAGNYQDVTASQVDYGINVGHTGETSYSAFADVTSIFSSNHWQDGNYTVSGIPVKEGEIGNLGTYGAWNLIIIYENSTKSMKSFSIFDGWDQVDSGRQDVPIEISGFYTPKQTPINSTVSVFAAEGDKHISRDHLYAIPKKKAPVQTELSHTSGQTFDSSIQTTPFYRLPDPLNNQGIDIQSFELGSSGLNILETEENNITFKFTSDQDRYWPSMIAFETEVYAPRFCYDYSYKQNFFYFTEDNNGTQEPMVQGSVNPHQDIEVSLYIRNEEDSDVAAENITLDFRDINSTQVTYVNNSVDVIFAGDTYRTNIAEPPVTTTSTSINNIPTGGIGGEEYFYTYYKVNPNVADINYTLAADINYSLVFYDAGGNELARYPYNSTIGGDDFPLCTGANFSYEPEWSIFNVVQSDLYDTAHQYYNIPTQVAGRPGRFDLVSFLPPPNENTENGVSTIISVEMIDAGAYHDINASCREPSSAISSKVWMLFENNTSKVAFDSASIQDAIDNGMTTMTSSTEMFNNATDNAAFRVSYLTTNDDNASLPNIVMHGNKVQVANFDHLISGNTMCIDNPATSIDSVCDTASISGNIGISKPQLSQCMECIFGISTTRICSRDNFAIRPESFNLRLIDLDQEDHNVTERFAEDRTGVASPNTSRVDLAAGYAYGLELNATSHHDNKAILGYRRNLSPAVATDYGVSFVWDPSDVSVTPMCNDDSNMSLTMDIYDGTSTSEQNLTQVGEYKLTAFDNTWTQVDYDTLYMQHHSDSTHFLGGVTGKDCLSTSSIVQNIDTSASFDSSSNVISNINGCKINSDHDNADASLRYRDYSTTFHPYELNTSALSFTHGNSLNIDFTNAWVYMNNISADDNISVNISGDIIAKGYDGTQLSNFVSGCYAEPIDLSVGRVLPTSIPVSYDFLLLDTNGTDTLATKTGDLNTTTILQPSPSLLDGNFTKAARGSTTIDLHMNFARTVNNPVNPLVVSFIDFNVTCATAANCQMKADLTAAHEAIGQKPILGSVTHYYGRVHAPRYRISENTGTLRLYYEVYCDPNTSSNPCTINDPSDHTQTMSNRLLSVDDIRWYRNEAHTSGVEGDINTSLPPRGLDALTANDRVDYDQANFIYDESKGYPYKTTIQVPSDSWLIYNKFDAAAMVNFFELEFNSAGRSVGKRIGVSSTDSNASRNTNRRIQW